MRVVSGVIALLLGIAALLGAGGLQTFWAPPETLTATVAAEAEEAPLTVITPGIDEVADDPVEYTLTGEGDYTVMLGRSRDVQAWVGDAAHNTVTGIETDVTDNGAPQVLVEHTEGEATVPDPAGSDLWVDVQEASGTIEQRWSVPSEGEWSLLVAADGTEPAPTELTVTWTNNVGTSPWIIPLAVIGALLILVGLALLAWAAITRRRDRDTGDPDGGTFTSTPARGAAGRSPGATSGPAGAPPKPSQAPRGGNGRARVAGAVAAVLAAGMVATGTAAADTAGTAEPTAVAGSEAAATDAPSTDAPSTDAPSAEAPDGDGDRFPVVTDGQLERILAKVAWIVDQGDRKQDVDTLRPRVGGQALQLRSHNYENLELSDSVQPQAPVAASPVLSVMAESDPEFPRTVIAVTEGEENATPQFLVLRQDSAREQYKLVANTPMTPGAQIPASELEDTEVATMASDDSSGLVMAPGHAVTGLARYLSDADDDFGARIHDNPYMDAIHEYQDETIADAEDARVYFSRRAVPDAAIAMRLADGSALVIGHLDARMSAAPREEGDRVVVDQLAGRRAGEGRRESTTPVRMTYREVVALHVPAEDASGDDAKVSLAGMTDELRAVSFD